MSLPKIVSYDEWAAAQKAFLDREKEATRRRDGLNTERRQLPMVEVTKPYAFEARPTARCRCSTSSTAAGS